MGMETIDDSLLRLMKTGKISRTSALKYAIQPERFMPASSQKNKMAQEMM